MPQCSWLLRLVSALYAWRGHSFNNPGSWIGECDYQFDPRFAGRWNSRHETAAIVGIILIVIGIIASLMVAWA